MEASLATMGEECSESGDSRWRLEEVATRVSMEEAWLEGTLGGGDRGVPASPKPAPAPAPAPAPLLPLRRIEPNATPPSERVRRMSRCWLGRWPK